MRLTPPNPPPTPSLCTCVHEPRRAVYELAKQLPEYGVGSRFALRKWEKKGAPDSYWTVTRMVPKPTGRSGKVWGTFTWKGELKNKGEVSRVTHAMKTGIWKVIEDDKPLEGPVLSVPPASSSAEGEDAAGGAEQK